MTPPSPEGERDIVERLRKRATWEYSEVLQDLLASAADEIERLRAAPSSSQGGEPKGESWTERNRALGRAGFDGGNSGRR